MIIGFMKIFNFIGICFLLCACTGSIPEYKPVSHTAGKTEFAHAYVGFKADKDKLKDALLKALAQRGWLVEGNAQGGVIAKRVHSDRTAKAFIVINDGEFVIDTAGSTIENKTPYIPETDLNYLLASVKENLK